jgi:Transposase zinc-ribbon domain
MTDAPGSLIQFQQRFPDEAACAAYLAAVRWPQGLICPRCGHAKAWLLQTKAWTYECAGCRKQTSVTAGTILHGSKLPLTLCDAFQRDLRPAIATATRLGLL